MTGVAAAAALGPWVAAPLDTGTERGSSATEVRSRLVEPDPGVVETVNGGRKQAMRILAAATIVVLAALTGCVRVKTDPVEVKPIRITVDVNLRIQRELQDFFGDIDAVDPTLKPN